MEQNIEMRSPRLNSELVIAERSDFVLIFLIGRSVGLTEALVFLNYRPD